LPPERGFWALLRAEVLFLLRGLLLDTSQHRSVWLFSKQENACSCHRVKESVVMTISDRSPLRHAPHTRSKSSQAFTLIELLVVIAIIAVLAGLLTPAASNAINSATRTTAKNQAVQIATAITAYETEYGRLPSVKGTNVSPDLVTMLCTTNDKENNPRGIMFLEASSWKKSKGGTNESGFCSPFGNSAVYSVGLDTNYENSIPSMPKQDSPGGAITTATLTKHVAVWTVWTNGTKTYLISSWD